MGKTMICIVELFFDEWHHGWCNSGFIKLVAENTNDKVAVVGTRRHLCALNELADISNVERYEVEIPERELALIENGKNSYIDLIQSIIQYYHLGPEDQMIFLSSFPAPFLAAVELNAHYKIQMLFVQHAELDKIFEENPNIFSKRMILEYASENFCNYFLTYSPFIEERLKGVLSDRALGRFVFLHHPIDGRPLECVHTDTVGAYGACITSNGFKKVLRSLSNKRADLSSFTVVRPAFSSNHLDYSFAFPPNVKIVQKAGGFSSEEQIAYIKEMGWIMIPYTKDQYVLSASGIFADAIRYERPIVGSECAYLTFYDNYVDGRIGFFEKDTENMTDRIIEIMNGKYTEEYTSYCHNIRLLKEKIKKENDDAIKTVLKL